MEAYFTKVLRLVPASLVALRLAIGPVLLLDAIDHHTSYWFIVGFLVAFFSDILDGIIARRIGVSTARLRQADSWADVCFYVCVFMSAWLVHQETVIAFRVPLMTLAIAQLSLYTLSWLKFGKFPSYHTYTAKTWGMTLCIATISLFGWNYAGVSLSLAIAVGFMNTIEETAITLMLSEWQHDVLSIFHVRKM